MSFSFWSFAAAVRPLAFAAVLTGAAYPLPGDLDTTFGNGGSVVQSFFDRDNAIAMAVQLDGKLVVAGTTTAHLWGDEDLLVARFHPDGSLDTGFGSMGKTSIDLAGGPDLATSVALQPDGKIVVAGAVLPAFSDDQTDKFAVVRFNPNGTLDATFGTGGKVITDFFGRYNRANAVVVQPDGRIIAAGTATRTNSESADFAMARYNADGTLDAAFGTGGKVVTHITAFPDIVNALALQADGKIVAGGTSRLDNNFYAGDFALARYNANGTLDRSFGSGGSVITDVTASDALIDEIRDLKLQTDGKIVAGGSARSLIFSGDKFAMARYSPKGELDTGFGSGGKVSTVFEDRSAASAVAVQRNGKIILTGSVTRPYDHFNDIAMARYNPNGSLDVTFGAGGRKIEELSSNSSTAATSSYIDPMGRILVAGVHSLQGSGGSDFMLARFLGDPVRSTGTEFGP